MNDEVFDLPEEAAEAGEGIPPEENEAEAAAESSGSGGAAENGSGSSEAETLREALSRAQERVTQLERERILLAQGVAEDDLDYYVFKIGKLTENGKSFSAAAKEFLKQQSAQHRAALRRSTGASLSGRTGGALSTNETMNRLLRGK